jgi:glutathione S-transferase
MLTIHGLPFSAHTRKVILAAIEKDIAYRLVPVVPLNPPPGWTDLSPLGLIPAIEDDGVTVADSSVICLYLERKSPQPSLYPSDPKQYARALWIEEFVDGGLAQHVLRGLLMQRVFAPKFLNQPPDEALIRKSLDEVIPPRLGYLEKSLEGEYFAGTAFSIADITVASILINYHYAGETLDDTRYPKLRGWLHRTLRRESFRKAFEQELPAAESVGALDMSLLRGLSRRAA